MKSRHRRVATIGRLIRDVRDNFDQFAMEFFDARRLSGSRLCRNRARLGHSVLTLVPGVYRPELFVGQSVGLGNSEPGKLARSAAWPLLWRPPSPPSSRCPHTQQRSPASSVPGGPVGWRPETPPIASAARLKGPRVSAGAGIARASETPAAVSGTRPLIARIYRPRRQTGRAQQIRFDHRTKTEHRATILLPNPVAADDTKRHATDRPVKIRRQINTRWGGGSRVAIAITEFRVRCIQLTAIALCGKACTQCRHAASGAVPTTTANQRGSIVSSASNEPVNRSSPLAIQMLHLSFCVSGTSRSPLRQGSFNHKQVIRRKDHVQRGKRLGQALSTTSANNWYDVFATR